MNAKQRALIAITVLCIDAKITPLHSYLWLLYNLHMTHEAKHKAIWPCLFIFIKWVRRWVIHILYDVSRNYDCEIWRRFMIPYFSVEVAKNVNWYQPSFWKHLFHNSRWASPPSSNSTNITGGYCVWNTCYLHTICLINKASSNYKVLFMIAFVNKRKNNKIKD